MVYCDNEDLRNTLCSVKPTGSGLYLHEIACISAASIGKLHIPTSDSVELKFLTDYYGVKKPALLIVSMIKRGYLKEATLDFFLEQIPLKIIQSFLKEQGLKPGNSRNSSIRILSDNNLKREFKDLTSFSFYEPTELGYKSLSGFDWTMVYHGWNIAVKRERRINKNTIPIIATSDYYTLHISSDRHSPDQLLLETDTIQTTLTSFAVLTCPNNLCIYFSPSDQIVLENVIRIERWKKNNSLLVEAQSSGGFHYYIYDIDNYCLSTEEVLEKRIGAISWNDPNWNDTYRASTNKQRPIILPSYDYYSENGDPCYYFCVTDELTDLIINHYLSREPGIQITILPSLMESNDQNYKLKTKPDNSEIYHLLYYLSKEPLNKSIQHSPV